MDEPFTSVWKICTGWACLLLLLGGIPGCGQPPEDKPNILLILADDLGYEKLGCYGNLHAGTPHLDKMAEEGIRFTRAYTSPICTPSRMSLYTGSYVTTHGYVTVLPIPQGTREYVDFDRWTTYAQLLRAEGYATSVTGKWQLGAMELYPGHCRKAGFDSWCVWQIMHQGEKTSRYWDPTYNVDGRIRKDTGSVFGPDLMTDYIIDRITQAAKEGKPFLIHHNMVLPHRPIVRTPLDKRLNRPASLDHMIFYLDIQVGRLINALRELEIEQNTLVFFLGDNGTKTNDPRWTEHGMVTGGKGDMNDAGMHVPLIVWGGGVDGGKSTDALVDMSDLLPTICQLAGVRISAGIEMDGISFAAVLEGNGPGSREYVTGGFLQDFAVFDGQWRLHKKGNMLIDCRDLPAEREANMETQQARRALKNLQPILRELTGTGGS